VRLKQFQSSREIGAPVRLVISDLTIPGDIGGVAVLQAIKKIHPNAKVIVSTGYLNDPVVSRCREFGFVDFVAKPFTINELSGVIARHLKP